jgi:hypothetical protein
MRMIESGSRLASTPMIDEVAPTGADANPPQAQTTAADPVSLPRPREIGGREGPEPTRYGDWEKAGRCIDF